MEVPNQSHLAEVCNLDYNGSEKDESHHVDRKTVSEDEHNYFYK